MKSTEEPGAGVPGAVVAGAAGEAAVDAGASVGVAVLGEGSVRDPSGAQAIIAAATATIVRVNRYRRRAGAASS